MGHGFNPRTGGFGPGEPLCDRAFGILFVVVMTLGAAMSVTALVAGVLAIRKFLL